MQLQFFCLFLFLLQLDSIASYPIRQGHLFVHPWEEYGSTFFFEAAEGSDQVPPMPPLLSAEPAQVIQPLLMEQVL